MAPSKSPHSSQVSLNSYLTNNSRFFITFVKTPHLDNAHVVFGEVADDESRAIVDKMETVGSGNGTTKGKITIERSGQL